MTPVTRKVYILTGAVLESLTWVKWDDALFYIASYSALHIYSQDSWTLSSAHSQSASGISSPNSASQSNVSSPFGIESNQKILGVYVVYSVYT